MANLHGVIPIVPTPFDTARQLDLGSLDRVIDYLVDAGVDGLAILGMASETITLTDRERLKVIRRAAARLAGRLPLVAGCSHISPQAVAQLAVETHAAGADVLMVMPPSIGRPEDNALEAYFTAAADASSASVMIQDNPNWHGVTLSLELYRRLARHPQIRCAKVETAHPPTTMTALSATVPDLALFGGQAGTWLPEEMRRGIAGTMPGAIIPKVYRDVWRLWHSGDRGGAVATFDKYYPLIRVTSTPRLGVPMTKAILADLGVIDCPAVRGPFADLGETDHADLEAVVSALDIATVMHPKRQMTSAEA